jgi:(1->4)-alpha-D-glucan 1-alpha-D-glucosylmutase
MNALSRLAQAHGIGLQYHDIWGTLHDVTPDTLRSLLCAMGVSVSTDRDADAALAALMQSRWRNRIAPMVVVREDASLLRMRLHLPHGLDVDSVHIVSETGEEQHRTPSSAMEAGEAIVDGEAWRARDIEVALAVPLGYHRLAFAAGGHVVAETRCAIVPRTCYRPPALRDGARTWGAAVQLYGVRSRRNWGIGDFTDLAGIIAGWGAQGAGIVGVNPLHALFPQDPLRNSPYSPSSRLFVNTLYLDVEAIADFTDCEPARTLVASPAFRKRLAALRDSALLDYLGVAAAKREVLDLLYASFRDRHLRRRTSRGASFLAFQQAGGEALHRYALFEALQEHCFALDASVWGWPAWPAQFRDPRSSDVARFAKERAERVDYYGYLQWQADLQRTAIANDANEAGLAIGVYTDLAVSIDRGGAEAWANQSLYATSASVGAPPDAFNPDGQDWGLPPLVPSRLRDAGYAPFIATLRANMRCAGALRIDHVMGLMRLFWVPQNKTPAAGAYVHYPFDDLVGLLALESQRNRCAVIGEDLGTVPDEVRRTLAERDVLSYRVLLFERDGAGEFKPPERYPDAALATASTHDLPTLAGWWQGHDIEVRAKLGLVGAETARLQDERAEDRRRLLRALEREHMLPPTPIPALPPPDRGKGDTSFPLLPGEGEGVRSPIPALPPPERGKGDISSPLLPGEGEGVRSGASADPRSWPEMTTELAESIMAFLAATPALIVVLQLEDVLLVREQANLPGTTDAHPNWRRKLPVAIEDVLDGEPLHSLAKRVSRIRAMPAAKTSTS